MYLLHPGAGTISPEIISSLITGGSDGGGGHTSDSIMSSVDRITPTRSGGSVRDDLSTKRRDEKREREQWQNLNQIEIGKQVISKHIRENFTLNQSRQQKENIVSRVMEKKLYIRDIRKSSWHEKDPSKQIASVMEKVTFSARLLSAEMKLLVKKPEGGRELQSCNIFEYNIVKLYYANKICARDVIKLDLYDAI